MKAGGIILVLACLFSACFTSHSQIKIVPRDRLEAVANPRHSSDSAWLDFNTRRVEAEMNEDDSPETFVYTMYNVGPETLQIHRIVTSCSCAVAVPERRTLDSGDSLKITVTYNPKGHPGRFERRIFVYTQEGNAPAAILVLAVNVGNSTDYSSDYRYQMGTIRLRRNQVEFTQGVKGIERIPFINLSGKLLKLECDGMMLPDCLGFSVEPVVVEDRHEGELVISYDPSKGRASETMPLILKGLGVPPSRSSIMIRINEK